MRLTKMFARRSSFFDNTRVDRTNGHQTWTNSDFATVATGSQQIQMTSTAPGAGHRLVPPQWSLCDLILAPETIDELMDFQTSIRDGSRLKCRHPRQTHIGPRALFHGPSGCGKSTTGHAVAKSLAIPLVLEAQLSSLVNSLVGKTIELIDRLFEAAETEDCLLLIDEADSLFGPRIEHPAQANDQFQNQNINHILMRLESYSKPVVLTTNLPQSMDAAMDRRVPFQIPFGLPSWSQRTQLWSLYLPPTLPITDDVTIDRLAELSEGFSPAEIEMVVYRASVRSLRVDPVEGRVTLGSIEKQIESRQAEKSHREKSKSVREHKISNRELPTEFSAKQTTSALK